MQQLKVFFFLVVFITTIWHSTYSQKCFGIRTNTERNRESVIENFDDGEITLESYPVEDHDPDSWELNSTITYQNSPWSLKLFGNTWKVENIEPVVVDSGDVWQVSAYIATQAEIQGFGIMDTANVLFYSFAGSQTLNPQLWVTVYQGCFSEDQWNNYQLPVADDWLAFFGYLPKISSLVFINDRDDVAQGVVYFDQILDISDDLPIAPEVSIEYTIGKTEKGRNGNRAVQVQFTSVVIDPDSDEHDFYWDFGDDATSSEQNPSHTFLVSDDHPYTVLLKVVDPDEKWGWASCRVEVDPGSSSFPVTLNFVGDIMLAREYEYPGGIIPTQGVEAIFEPTMPYLGNAADITVANFECTLTTAWQHHPTKEIYYKGSPQNVTGLTYAGIDIVSLANNHIMDYLQPGMQQTQSVLKQNGIVFSGAGINSYEAYLPAFFSRKGVNFAFLASSDRDGQYVNNQPYLNAGFNKPGFANMGKYYIKKQIDEVRDVSDLVVMEFHNGSEYSFIPDNGENPDVPFVGDLGLVEDYSPLSRFPGKRDLEIRHFAIDNGADLVICHHPHILQPVELYNGKLIAHSLGNFAFDLPYPETCPSIILNAEVNKNGFSEFTLTPVYIDDFIPVRATGELGLHILDDLAWRSKGFNTYLQVDRENVTAKVIMDTLNLVTFETEYFVELALEEVNGNWETAPCFLEKSGSISSVFDIQPSGSYEFRLGRDEIWFGNMEDEGCTLWNLNSADEIYCDTVAYTGERSIQLQRAANAPYNIVTNFEHRIICHSDTLHYSLCGFIKTQNGDGVNIEIQYFDDFEALVSIGQEDLGANVHGDTPWTFFHKELTLPFGTEYFDVRLNCDVPNSGTAYAWFDNVSLICWEDWIVFDEATTIPAPNDYYFLQVRSEQNWGEIAISYTETVFDETTVGTEEPENSDLSNSLLNQNFPNPFNPATGFTTFSFYLDKAEKVTLNIFDSKGQKISVLANSGFQPGTHTFTWDGNNMNGQPVSSGVYFYELKTTSLKQTRKCVLLRW